MRPILVVALVALALLRPAVAQSWEIPAGVKTLTVNGYPMAFQERGSGPSIVFVHGALSDYRSWGAQVAAPPAGYRVIAVSLRHYYPEKWTGKGGNFSTTQHADDLIKFIEQLGTGPVHLVGHSRGGIVAALAAKTRPDLVSKLVLMEPGFVALAREANPQGQQSIVAALREAKASFERGDIEGGLMAFADRDLPGSWVQMDEEEKTRRRDNAWTLIELGASAPVTCEVLASLTMPVLLMQGEASPRRYQEIVRAAEKCLLPATRATIPGAGHAMHRMNPVAFQSELIKFLSRAGPTRQ